jgi:Asp-tRNA(Asn)/Glu-tRNA(Gln) amidotransferase A subunit family amidase
LASFRHFARAPNWLRSTTSRESQLASFRNYASVDPAAATAPGNFAANLPVALQLAGKPFLENRLLGIGREFQASTDWRKRRPPE